MSWNKLNLIFGLISLSSTQTVYMEKQSLILKQLRVKAKLSQIQSSLTANLQNKTARYFIYSSSSFMTT